MANDWRSMQHDAAVATQGLTSTIDYIWRLHRECPKVIEAEYADLHQAHVALTKLLHTLKREAA